MRRQVSDGVQVSDVVKAWCVGVRLKVCMREVQERITCRKQQVTEWRQQVSDRRQEVLNAINRRPWPAPYRHQQITHEAEGIVTVWEGGIAVPAANWSPSPAHYCRSHPFRLRRARRSWHSSCKTLLAGFCHPHRSCHSPCRRRPLKRLAAAAAASCGPHPLGSPPQALRVSIAASCYPHPSGSP